MKEPLLRIPRPPRQRWHDIRLRHVPIAVYLAGIVGIVYLWNTQWMPSSFTGEVQAPVADVASPIDGMVTKITVHQFDEVVQGQVLGQVVLAPEAAEAELIAIRADLAVMRGRMMLDQRRVSEGYEQLRANQLDQKISLAIAVSRLRFAESELARQKTMRDAGIESQSAYELALDERDRLAAEIKERTALITEMEASLATMKPSATDEGASGIANTIDAAIRAQQERLAQAGTTVLKAPISGLVTKIYRLDAANVRAGEPLITISSDRPEQIIGFVRQPIAFEPQVGDEVVVRTRRNKRQAAEARIVKVGARMEFFTQSLRVRGFDSSQERGLPVLISLPPGLSLHPGELVDLAIKNTIKSGADAPAEKL